MINSADTLIDLDSKGGTGTLVETYFPWADEPVAAKLKPVRANPLPRGTETLLVVEDEPAVKLLACRVLKAQGYEVLSASNGQDALHVAHEHHGTPISLVVTDVIMPLMGGKVMALWLKTIDPKVKVLFTSGYTDEVVARQGVPSTGSEFLPKPYTPAVLVRRVREILGS